MKYPRKVYAIRHNVTDRVYIGSSCNVDKRFKEHLYALKAHNHVVDDMQRDYDEYGKDYTFTILDRINDSSEDEKEYEWMDKYQSFVRGIGYNYKDHHRSQRAKNNEEESLAMVSSEDLDSENTHTEYKIELLTLILKHRNDPEALAKIKFILDQFVHNRKPVLNIINQND